MAFTNVKDLTTFQLKFDDVTGHKFKLKNANNGKQQQIINYFHGWEFADLF